MNKKYFFPNEQSLTQFAYSVSEVCTEGVIIFLQGQLGAGKTTFVRGFLRACGYKGIVKSPTYTLVESYSSNEIPIYHFDFYRLNSAEELEYLGLRDYLSKNSICLIEWPEKAEGLLPDATLYCKIEVPLNANGRWFELSSNDKKGIEIINAINER